MKKLNFFILLINATLGISQNILSNDTLYIKEVFYKKCYIDEDHVYMSGGKCYWNGQQITKEAYTRLDSFRVNFCDSIMAKSQGRYIKFYNNDSIVIREGTWYREFYTGNYKEYYDNGKLKVLGLYSDGKDGKDEGTEIGKWYYYDTKGKVKKVIDYSKKKSGK